MEYHEATTGFFQFQTIAKLDCKNAFSFTSDSIDGLKITSCNVYKNNLYKATGENEKSNPPALIFVRTKDLIVDNFYFSENNLGDVGKFTAKENNDTLTIRLVNCHAETNRQEYWNFSESNGFSESAKFSKSEVFSYSSSFSKSSSFTESKEFSQSDRITKSIDFSSSEVSPLIEYAGKSNKGVVIGAVVGAGVIAGVVAFFLIKRRRSLQEDAANMMNETDASISSLDLNQLSLEELGDLFQNDIYSTKFDSSTTVNFIKEIKREKMKNQERMTNFENEIHEKLVEIEKNCFW